MPDLRAEGARSKMEPPPHSMIVNRHLNSSGVRNCCDYCLQKSAVSDSSLLNKTNISNNYLLLKIIF